MQNTIHILWQMLLITLLSTAVIAANIASFKVLKVLWAGRKHQRLIASKFIKIVQCDIIDDVNKLLILLSDEIWPVDRKTIIEYLYNIEIYAKALSVPAKKVKP